MKEPSRWYIPCRLGCAGLLRISSRGSEPWHDLVPPFYTAIYFAAGFLECECKATSAACGVYGVSVWFVRLPVSLYYRYRNRESRNSVIATSDCLGHCCMRVMNWRQHRLGAPARAKLTQCHTRKELTTQQTISTTFYFVFLRLY